MDPERCATDITSNLLVFFLFHAGSPTIQTSNQPTVRQKSDLSGVARGEFTACDMFRHEGTGFVKNAMV